MEILIIHKLKKAKQFIGYYFNLVETLLFRGIW